MLCAFAGMSSVSVCPHPSYLSWLLFPYYDSSEDSI
jgi:hypothetical protein